MELCREVGNEGKPCCAEEAGIVARTGWKKPITE